MKLKQFLSASMTCIAVTVFSAIPALLTPLAARTAADFGHGPAWFSLLFASFYIPCILACLFAGKLVSGAGRHFSVSLSLGACTLASALLSYADQLLPLCLCLALLGIASAFALITGVEALRILLGCSVEDCLPWCAVPMAFAAAIAALSSGLLTRYGYTWHDVWLLFAVSLAILTILHIIVPYPHVRYVNAKKWGAEFLSALRVQRMYPCFFAVFLYAGLEEIIAGWMAACSLRSLGYTTLIASTAIAIIWVCAAIARIVCGHLSARFSPLGMSFFLVSILVCSLGICTAFADGLLFWLAICGVGIGLSGIWQLLIASAVSISGGRCASFSALLLWGCMGAALLPPLASAVGSVLGMRSVIAFAILLLLLNGILFGSVMQRKPLKATAFFSGEPVEAEWEALFLEEFREPDSYENPAEAFDYPADDAYSFSDEEVFGFPQEEDYAAFADDDEFADFFKDLDRYDDLKPFENFDVLQPLRVPQPDVAEDLQDLEAAEGLEVLDEDAAESFVFPERPFLEDFAEEPDFAGSADSADFIDVANGAASAAQLDGPAEPEPFAQPLTSAPLEPVAYHAEPDSDDVALSDEIGEPGSPEEAWPQEQLPEEPFPESSENRSDT